MVAALAITLTLYENDGDYYFVSFGFIQHLKLPIGSEQKPN